MLGLEDAFGQRVDPGRRYRLDRALHRAGGVHALIGERLRPCIGQARHRILLELQAGNCLVLRRRHQVGRNALGDRIGHDRIDALQHLVCITTPRKGRLGKAQARLRQKRTTEAGKKRLARHAHGKQVAALGPQRLRQHHGGRIVLVAQTRHAPGPQHQADRVISGQLHGMRRHLPEPESRPFRNRLARYVTEQRLHLGQRGLRIDIACNHQDGVVGCIPAVMKGLQGLGRGLVERGARAQSGMRIGRALEHALPQLGEELVAGIGVVARHFLLDRATLLFPIPGIHVHATHADGMNFQRHVKIRRGHGKEILGYAFGRVGIEITAHVGGNRAELVLAQARAAAEHHVLDRMRGTGKTFRHFVGTGQIVHLRGHHRRQRVAHDHDTQTIIQGRAGDTAGDGFGDRRDGAAKSHQRGQSGQNREPALLCHHFTPLPHQATPNASAENGRPSGKSVCMHGLDETEPVGIKSTAGDARPCAWVQRRF